MKYPLKMIPYLKETVWGGYNLRRMFNKTSGELAHRARIGESWEVSARAEAPSLIGNGPLAGKTLEAALPYLGGGWSSLCGRGFSRFPLLVKYLDAADDLSVQVHPPDGFAEEISGKTEMWLIIAAKPGSKLYRGLRRSADIRELRGAAESGRLHELLNCSEVSPGEVYFIPAGTLHALGGGITAAEIQQNSDITYRLYDWGRVLPNGGRRELHLEEGLAAANINPAPGGADSIFPGKGRAGLLRCPQFWVEGEVLSGGAVRAGDGNMEILIFISGSGFIESGAGRWNWTAGDTYLLPEGIDTCSAVGEGMMLRVTVPF